MNWLYRLLGINLNSVSRGSSDPCRGYKNEINQYTRENNWHIRDRNRWRSRANNYLRRLNKLKNRSQSFPKNMNPSNTKYFVDDMVRKAGIENVKLENIQKNHIFTQDTMQKDREKIINNLKNKKHKLNSQLLQNDRLLMYRSTNINILRVLYKLILLIVIIVTVLYLYKYIIANIL